MFNQYYRSITRLTRLFFVCFSMMSVPANADRIKDLGSFDGLRSNQLTGYGIVVGLNGTGDDSLQYVTQGVKGMVTRFGVSLPAGVNPSLKNSAAVLVTAELSPFAKPGQRLDITVSAIGKAKSLRGGTLIMMPLHGADGQIYAMAQGNLAVGGLGVGAADGSRTTINIPSVGRIAGGGTVERAVISRFGSTPFLTFNLAKSDLTTALRIAHAIMDKLPDTIASASDGVSIRIDAPPSVRDRVKLMSVIENITVTPAEAPAKVIINARTGTVVINSAVRISPAAISHGKLTVKIEESPTVVQPAPFSRGQTAVEPSSEITVAEEKSPMFKLAPGASLAEIVNAINEIGVSPGDLAAILDALKQAGALKAELVII